MECGKKLRSRNYLQPIVVVVAGEVNVIDEVLLLETCADDVVAARTLSRVAIARLRADLRRTQQQATVDKSLTAILTFGRLTINAIERSVTFDGRRIMVSPADFDLLWVLACNAGRTVSREELEVCLRGFNSDESRRFVDTRVFRLRRQFKDQCPLAPARIRSIRSQGYMFSLEDW
jgi:DNA-binding response OmpR family regulator